jgi:hypothetical protein
MDNELINSIYKAVAAKEENRLKELAFEMEVQTLEASHFPQWSFELILEIMKHQEFLHMKGSWHLLMVIEHDWEKLTDYQKDELLVALETSFGQFSDWMSWFVISEIFGEYYANEQAFQVLCRLKTINDEGPRSFVPHGLEHIIKGTDNRNLSEKAFKELLQMKNDIAENVRHEAALSLQRLTNTGYAEELG